MAVADHAPTFWVVDVVCEGFGRTHCLHFQDKRVCSSETLANTELHGVTTQKFLMFRQ
jgi:hypothetical protein